MKQMLLETRHKAEELLKDALAIWRQSNQADFLEDIEKDPVFSLLMMALAYQSNELDSEIERLKSEVLEDFARLLVPYEMGHATPASAVIQTALQDEVAEITLGEDTVFNLATGYPFLPLLQTRVLNASVHSVTRLDGRRWKVSLNFRFPVTDLSRFAFMVRGVNFKNLAVSVKGQLLPLVKPWHLSELPLTPCFSETSLTYNMGQMCTMSSLPMDIFARQNLRLFIIEDHTPKKFIPAETEHLDLVFEFMGIPEDFSFGPDNICLNPVLLVNARIGEATLSSASPVARITPGDGTLSDTDYSARQFLHLLRPLESQVYGNMELEVRGVAGDRFNQGSLTKLLNCIITKYHSDYYAFHKLNSSTTENSVLQIQTALSHLKEESTRNILNSVSGVYVMPRGKVPANDFSLNVRYLTTSGAAVNSLLDASSHFAAPSGFRPDTSLISTPVPGTDEIRNEEALDSIARYCLVTGDRIVTQADIKFFCKKELMTRYGIGSNMIKRMRVNKRLQRDATGCGYEIVMEITLAGSSIIKRSMADKIPQAELLMQKMIEVRSANIYPVSVSINIEDEEEK